LTRDLKAEALGNACKSECDEPSRELLRALAAELGRADERDRNKQEIERLRAENEALRGRIHPWYGPCDAFCDDGACAECERVAALPVAIYRSYLSAVLDGAPAPERRYFGQAGHCHDIDGNLWHGVGECKAPHTSPCCGYEGGADPLVTRVAEMRAALEPFAKKFGQIVGPTDGDGLMVAFMFPVDDFRRATRALGASR